MKLGLCYYRGFVLGWERLLMHPETSGPEEKSSQKYDLLDSYDERDRVGDDLSSLRGQEIQISSADKELEENKEKETFNKMAPPIMESAPTLSSPSRQISKYVVFRLDVIYGNDRHFLLGCAMKQQS